MIHEIKLAVSDVTGIPIEAMDKRNDKGKLSRNREIALARQWVYYFIRQRTSLGFKNIGKTFGGQDHSTVIYACSLINDLMTYDKSVRETHKAITKKLADLTSPQEKDWEPQVLSALYLGHAEAH